MTPWRILAARHGGYVPISATAVILAALFAALHGGGPVPVLGQMPLLPVTAAAAVAGFPLLLFLQRRAAPRSRQMPGPARSAALLIAAGALLSLPPIAIDIATGFARDINVALPLALLFYPSVALSAEVAFHLAPLAALTWLGSRGAPPTWAYAVVILTEPAFQAAHYWNGGVQAWLVLANVTAISAAQIWLFVRYGFAAMIALRLTFYLFWHLVWGTLRLSVLF